MPTTFGPGLPGIREWTERHYSFAGYVPGFDLRAVADRAALRAELGYGDEPLCLVAVGGSGVGTPLLRRVIEALPLARERVPGLRTVAVAGPRIDPTSLPQADGLEVRGYVHELYRHLAACDVAVVQGGLTTTMELVAAQRPFVSIPLASHFEQRVPRPPPPRPLRRGGLARLQRREPGGAGGRDRRRVRERAILPPDRTRRRRDSSRAHRRTPPIADEADRERRLSSASRRRRADLFGVIRLRARFN